MATNKGKLKYTSGSFKSSDDIKEDITKIIKIVKANLTTEDKKALDELLAEIENTEFGTRSSGYVNNMPVEIREKISSLLVVPGRPTLITAQEVSDTSKLLDAISAYCKASESARLLLASSLKEKTEQYDAAVARISQLSQELEDSKKSYSTDSGKAAKFNKASALTAGIAGVLLAGSLVAMGITHNMWGRDRDALAKAQAELDALKSSQSGSLAEDELNQVKDALGNVYIPGADISDTVGSVVGDNSNLTQENAGLTQENAGLKTENDSLTQENAGLTQENAGLKTENDSLTQENAGLTQENAGLKTENDSLTQENAGLKTENAGLKAELDEVKDILTGSGVTVNGSDVSSAVKNVIDALTQGGQITPEDGITQDDVDDVYELVADALTQLGITEADLQEGGIYSEGKLKAVIGDIVETYVENEQTIDTITGKIDSTLSGIKKYGSDASYTLADFTTIEDACDFIQTHYAHKFNEVFDNFSKGDGSKYTLADFENMSDAVDWLDEKLTQLQTDYDNAVDANEALEEAVSSLTNEKTALEEKVNTLEEALKESNNLGQSSSGNESGNTENAPVTDKEVDETVSPEQDRKDEEYTDTGFTPGV